MNNNLLVKNVNFSYGKHKVLNEISFSCENGITALLGPNGAGKTTLMNILVGLKSPSSGYITLNNTDISNIKNNGIDNIGYLPQHFDIYPNISGYDFLSYVCDIKGIKSTKKIQAMDEVISKFNLNDVIKKSFGKYSGGYKQRLGIAQAVIGHPKLIIIDEPTVGLDPEQRLEFRHYLSHIGNDQITLISTHIIEDAELYSKNVIIMKNGDIILDSDINEVISQAAKNIYTLVCDLNDFKDIQSRVTLIEERRLNNDLIKIKFIKDEHVLNGSYPTKEVSLENAYVFFQK
ncbi:ABC transporter ATP-binding protein [Clostridium putrefaciens]|uniref:ABC transporter ATP-binding protein n=1 Tax=Clostridium putrefaciens TaxID=99675 RepID=A0A381J3K2_9CLOT|nr:ATP-binding cassette domain-containing protein [Clostridium putrefaciens]SUY44937.1 ABC transporter ATP-binding protein [Clostridium putrefaciens]